MASLPSSISIDSLGGSKQDYLCASVDSSTDASADDWNSLISTVAMGSRMVPRARVIFTGSAGTPALVSWEAVWKGVTPTAPTLARTGTGTFTVTFPASVLDELGDTQSLSFQDATVSPRGSVRYGAQCAAPSANAVTVYTFNAAGTANDGVGINFSVLFF